MKRGFVPSCRRKVAGAVLPKDPSKEKERKHDAGDTTRDSRCGGGDTVRGAAWRGPGAKSPLDAVAERLAALGVRVRNQPVTAADLPGLQAVRITAPLSRQVTDADCALFRELPRLNILGIAGAQQVTTAGIAEIATLQGLRFLDLSQTPVDDAGLEALAASRSVQSLALNGSSGITDAGLAHLRRMEQLAALELGNQQALTDAGIAALAGHPALARLSLGYCTGLTDAALGPIGTDRKSTRLNSSHGLRSRMPSSA
jgi:hypothetical protein